MMDNFCPVTVAMVMAVQNQILPLADTPPQMTGIRIQVHCNSQLFLPPIKTGEISKNIHILSLRFGWYVLAKGWLLFDFVGIKNPLSFPRVLHSS